MILYADNMTKSLKSALETSNKRRETQLAHNTEHGITPRSVSRPIQEPLVKREDKTINIAKKSKSELEKILAQMQKDMMDAAERLDFERAALIRDQIKAIRKSS